MKTKISILLISGVVLSTSLLAGTSQASNPISQGAYPVEYDYFDLLTCAEKVADGEHSSKCEAYWSGKQPSQIKSTSTSANMLFANATNLHIELDYTSNSVAPVAYEKTRCAARSNKPAAVTNAENRSVTCTDPNDDYLLATSTDNKSGNPTRIVIPKEEFKPLSVYMDQDHEALENYIDTKLGWAKANWGWTPQPEKAGFPDRARRWRITGLAGNETIMQEGARAVCARWHPKSKECIDLHEDDGYGGGTYQKAYTKGSTEITYVAYPDKDRMCLDLGENEYQFTFQHHDYNWRWRYPKTGETWGLGQFDPYEIQYQGNSKYPGLNPNASYLYSISPANWKNKHNLEAVVYRKKFFYCLSNTTPEPRDMYYRTEASERCDSQAKYADGSTNYSCSWNVKEKVYMPEEKLVPIQVGDITTMIPYMNLKDALASWTVDSGSYSSSVPYEKNSVFAYCEANPIEDGVDPREESLCQDQAAGTTGFCLGYFPEISSSGKVILSSAYYIGDKTLENYCVAGAPLKIQSKFYNKSGSSLPFKIDGEKSYISYTTDSVNELEWIRAQKYFSNQLDMKVSRLTTILAMGYDSSSTGVTKQETLCGLSQTLYDIVGADYRDEFYARGTSGYPLDDYDQAYGCADSVDYYWKDINDPVHGNRGMRSISGVRGIIDTVITVNTRMSGSATVDAMISDLNAEISSYLVDVINPFITKVNNHMANRAHAACSDLTAAINGMYQKLVLDGVYDAESDIPGKITVNCSAN